MNNLRHFITHNVAYNIQMRSFSISNLTMFTSGCAARVLISTLCVLYTTLLYISEILNNRLNDFKIIISWTRLNYLIVFQHI